MTFSFMDKNQNMLLKNVERRPEEMSREVCRLRRCASAWPAGVRLLKGRRWSRGASSLSAPACPSAKCCFCTALELRMFFCAFKGLPKTTTTKQGRIRNRGHLGPPKSGI